MTIALQGFTLNEPHVASSMCHL